MLVPLLLIAALPDAALMGDGAANYVETVRYDLEAELDPAAKIVKGRGTITWTNRGSKPVRELWWHLYLNAFRNERSTFLMEEKKLRSEEFSRGDWGWVEIGKLSAKGHELSRIFEHPDDDNAEDRTVMRTPLPFEVAPGSSVELSIEFTSKLPKVFARSGWGGTFFMVAQWFPKLGVLEETWRDVIETSTPSWNCHQYHATSEFFADYGSYRVAITVPSDHVVGATGVRVAEKSEGGKTTYVHEQDRVHDFAFAVDPRFSVEKRMFDPAVDRTEASALLGIEVPELSAVEVTLLYQPEHAMYADRYFRAVFESLKWFGLWYGAYPYRTLTVIDGPRVAWGAMGMEYPTLITGGVSWPQADSSPSPEMVTVHEFGHQYWYGLVGSNEFEEAWLDEGFNVYSTGKVVDRAYGPFTYAPKLLGLPLTPWFSGLQMDQIATHRIPTLWYPPSDAIARRSWEYRSVRSYGINSYPRTALALRQLEIELGEQAFARAMRAYHLRWRYRHPTMRDFIAVVEESAGRSLDHWFEPVFYSSDEIDYQVTELKSARRTAAAGIFDELREVTVEEAEDLEEELFDTTVYVERKRGAQHPVTLEIAFEDGSTERVKWDGLYRWQRFKLAKPSRAKHALLHPDGELLLDLDRGNDSRTVSSDPLPGATWGSHVLYVAQTILQLLGGLL